MELRKRLQDMRIPRPYTAPDIAAAGPRLANAFRSIRDFFLRVAPSFEHSGMAIRDFFLEVVASFKHSGMAIQDFFLRVAPSFEHSGMAIRDFFLKVVASFKHSGMAIQDFFLRVAPSFKHSGVAIRDFVLKVVASFKHAGMVIRDAALWLYRAPSNFVLMVARAIDVAVQRIKAVTLFATRFALVWGARFLAFLVVCAIARLAYTAYKSYQAKQYLRGVEKARAQIQEEHYRRIEQEQRRRQEEAQEEARWEALRRQQQLEDLRLYNSWKAACDKIFEASSGKLPEPPSWPCSEMKCQGERQLSACSHSLRRLFSATGNLQETLLEERNRWHPNKAVFHRLPPGSERMATEIAQVIQSLLP